jgi:hypothetical protein
MIACIGPSSLLHLLASYSWSCHACKHSRESLSHSVSGKSARARMHNFTAARHKHRAAEVTCLVGLRGVKQSTIHK